MRHMARALAILAVAVGAIESLTIPATLGSQPRLSGQQAEATRLEQARFSRPPTQAVRFRTAKEARSRLSNLRPPRQSFPEKSEQYVEGFARIAGDETTGRIWAMAIRRSNAETAYASCGFKSEAIDFGGTNAIKKAKATAKIDIRKMEIKEKANFRLILTAAIWKDGEFVAKGTADLPGEGTYSVTTDPVDLVPGATYHASGHLTILGPTGVGTSIVITDAQITSIRWVF